MKINSLGSPRGRTAPIRVCMLAYTRYPFDGRIRLEAESLAQLDHEVTCVVPKEGKRPRSYTLAGVSVRELNAGKYDGKNKLRYILSYISFLLLAFATCTRLFISSRIRVFHVHNMPDVLVFAAIIARLFNGKIILDLHDTIPETYQAKFGGGSQLLLSILRLEERVSCSLAHRIICVNHVQREAVIQRGIRAGKISTVVTMPRMLVPMQSQRSQSEGQVFRLVNHGTISKRLGNDLIVQAAATLAREIPGFELHIIGGGDNMPELLKMTRSLGLEQIVQFHKPVPWDTLAKKLSIMDAGIVANRANVATQLMLPAKLIDYVVLGIPAIVPRLKAIQYYFSPEMVSYFDPANVDSIIATTISLYQDKGRRERQAINAKTFLYENAWDLPGNGVKAVYEELFKDEAGNLRHTALSLGTGRALLPNKGDKL